MYLFSVVAQVPASHMHQPALGHAIAITETSHYSLPFPVQLLPVNKVLIYVLSGVLLR